MHVSVIAKLSVIAAIAMAISAGCANWVANEASQSTAELPFTPVGQSPGSLVVEVSFVELALDSLAESELNDSIWQWIDETKIDAAQRGRLLANGIRAGFVSNEDQFRRRLNAATVASDVIDEFLAEAEVKSDLAQGSKRLPLRFGQRYELPLRQPIEGSVVTLVNLAGDAVGQTLLRPQPVFAITARRSTHVNQVEIQFRPEIQHGTARQSWVASDSAFRIETRRETWSLPELDLDITAGQADLLIIAADLPARGLGKQMLTGIGSDQSVQQVLLLIDIAHVPSVLP
jgi:hypothetical protein